MLFVVFVVAWAAGCGCCAREAGEAREGEEEGKGEGEGVACGGRVGVASGFLGVEWSWPSYS